MKRTLTFILSIISTCIALAGPVGEEDSVFVASYKSGNGLRMAYSIDQSHWTLIGNDYNLLSSDFGEWGSQKKMASSPSVMRDTDGEWYAVWALNDESNQFATAHTHRLHVWVPQDYPYMTTKNENVVEPILTKKGGRFHVTYKTGKGNVYVTTSDDFIHWTAAKAVSTADYDNAVKQSGTTMLHLLGRQRPATITKTTWQEVENLIARAEAAGYRAQNDNVGFSDDRRLYGSVQNLKVELTADLSKSKAISPDLFGIFFEDINFAADGGLYGELLQNRDFEYSDYDRGGWNAQTAWTMIGEGLEWSISTDSPIHANNSHYAVLKGTKKGGMIANEGYGGIAVKKGEKYDFSVLLRSAGTSAEKVSVSLISDGKVLAKATLTASKGKWQQKKAVLVPTEDCVNAMLAIEPLGTGTVNVDFASLFPRNTFKNRKNGMRADLAQTLADLKPRFVRFPGGCASHGNGIDNIYHWQATVGPLWERQYDRNIWNYHQSRGLGFYEYFQFCEDINAEPLPVLAAGVPCQNSRYGGHGQQGGIPWERDLKALAEKEGKTIDEVAEHKYMGKALTMESYLQELLDLIEWANGDAKTSKLAKMRAKTGHPAPFNLKYLGIGNEDLISEVFAERYTWLCREVKKAHPEITVVGTVGPFWEGSDYERGWELARKESIEIVDEHYYNPIGWYINHQDFYDRYPRTGTKVYLGEWASKGNRWDNALAEAIHITNLERNADVVVMSSYAPLLARERNTQWNPDLIYFNATEVKPTPNYYVQMLGGQNAGSEYIFSDMSVSDYKSMQRVAASIVRDDNGDVIVKIVNALPVDATLALNIGDISGMKVIKTQMTAAINAHKVDAPVAEEIASDSLSALQLPQYSFTVLRLKK